jgi:hypothetical protein
LASVADEGKMRWICNFPRRREYTGDGVSPLRLCEAEDLTYSRDNKHKLPWDLDMAHLFHCTLLWAIRAIVVTVMPYEVTIDEASDRNRAKLDEAKEEEDMKI